MSATLTTNPATRRLHLPRTDIFGREREIRELADLLAKPDLACLTIIGPGGVGKTRIAVQVAADLAADPSGPFPDGIWFVPLAAVQDPEQAPAAILSELGVEIGDEAPADALIGYLRERETLLVLDNVEQVIDIAPFVATLAAECRDVKIVVTSRRPLRITGEQEYALAPLPLPAPSDGTPAEELRANPAVALFIQRAQMINPVLALDDRAIAAIAQICRGLDGLPLAIELAAARVKALSPTALASQLGNRLRVLVGGPRDAPARQQTLRAAIAWSYDILAPWEQQLFWRLAIFSGGFSLGLVEQFQAAAAGVEPGFDEEPLEIIAALVDHSLIQAVDDAAEDPRWQMLETIREFGVEQVAAAGLESTYRRLHAAVMAGIADQVEDAMYGAQQSAWIDRLAADANNFRAAINWAVAHGEKEIALRIAGPLWRFWSYCHLGNEGRATLARALAMPGEVSLPVLGAALRGAGCLHEDISDHANAEAYHRRALEVWTQLGDTRKIARSTDDLGNVAHEQGDFDLAERLHFEALRIARENGHMRVVASSLANLGSTAYLRGDVAAARDRWLEVIATNAVDDPISRTVVTNNLGVAYLHLGELDQAATYLHAALAVHRDLGMPPNAADVLINLSDLASRNGDLAQARTYFEAAREIYHRLDDPKGLHNIYFSIGAEEHLNQGNPQVALDAFRISLVYADRANNRLGFADGIERIAAIVAETPKTAEAAVLLGAARSIRETIGAQPLPDQRRINEETDARLHRSLGDVGYAKAIAAGGTLPPRQAAQKAMQLAEALAQTDPTVRRPPASTGTAAPTPSDDSPFRLTKREIEVLRLLSEGKTDRDIAAALFISPRTAGTHVSNILGKLDVETRAAAVAAAFRHGLL